MASLDSVKTRAYLAEGIVRQQGADTSVALRIFYVGNGAPESVVVTTATNVALKEDGVTAVTYAFATYTTVGALADAINASGKWRAIVADALRSDATGSSAFVTGAVTVGADEDGVPAWDVKVDSSVALRVASTLSPRGFNFAPRPKGHRVHLLEISYFATLGAAAADRVRVYRRKGGVETQIFGLLSVSGTGTTVNWASGNGKITGGPDEEIIVRLHDGTSIADAALALRAVGIRE